MIERFIYMALRNGITQIEEDPSLLELLFRDLYELDTAEVEAIKTVFAAKTPKVLHGYAPRDVEVPCYSIILQSESESVRFLNDDAPQIDDIDDIDFGADVKSTVWEHSYQILTYTEHPDVTAYFYQIAKSIILAQGDFFDNHGVFNIQLSGQDLMPDPRYIPEHLFARNLTFRCDDEFLRVDRESLGGKAFTIGGLHIDNTGSPSEVGGVKTLITPDPVED